MVNPLPNPAPSWNVAPNERLAVVRCLPEIGALVEGGKQPGAIVGQEGGP
jgi:hypothetical protein